MPHAPLRVYVMGERGANREPATPEDIAKMRDSPRGDRGRRARLLHLAQRSTTRRSTAVTADLGTAEDGAAGIAEALGEAGGRLFQLISDFDDPSGEIGICLAGWQKGDGRPMEDDAHQRQRPGWSLARHLLDRVAQSSTDGLSW